MVRRVSATITQGQWLQVQMLLFLAGFTGLPFV